MAGINKTKLNKEITDKYSVKDNTFIAVAKDNPKDKIEVEIGDSKTLDKFLPQQKIMRWDNECNVSIRLKETEIGTEKVETKDDKIVWSKGNIEANFYDLNNTDHPEGASEFEITLKEKPLTNIVEFTVVDKDVDYFYQPTLTPEEIEQGSQRPENVVGSYAVYAKTPKTNWTGGKEYKVGKVGHIFRPKIIDSAGTEVWGDLHIENGILSVTIPQEFLDKAVYPVRHAAGLTFGYTTAGSGYVVFAANYIFCSGTAETGAAGTGVSMTLKASYAGSANVQMGIYKSSDNTLLTNGYTGTVVVGSTMQEYTANFASGPTTAAVGYYLAVNSNQAVKWIADDVGTNLRYKSQAFGTWPAGPITWDRDFTKRFYIYATYTDSATDPAPSVSDSTAVTDAPTIVRGDVPALTISVADSTAVTDTPTIKNPTEFISVADSTTITDTPTLKIPTNYISVADSSAVSDTFSFKISDSLLSVADSTAVTDAVTIFQTSYKISVTDSTAVADTPTVSVGTLPTATISVTDSTVVSDAIVLYETSYKISVADSTAATDTPTLKIPTNYISVADSTAVGESISFSITSPNPIINVSDSTTVTDTPTLKIPTNYVSVADSTAVTDTPTIKNPTEFISVSDSTTVTDAPTIVLGTLLPQTINVLDSTTISETVAFKLSDPIISVADIITVSESASLLLNMNISVDDSTTVSESVNFVRIDTLHSGIIMRSSENLYAAGITKEKDFKMNSKENQYPLPMDDKIIR